MTVNDFLAEYELMGWIVEWRHEIIKKDDKGKVLYSRWTGWERQWNNKVYDTREIAQAAFGENDGYWPNTQIRYRPVYSKKSN